MQGTVRASYRYSAPTSPERNASWAGLELAIEVAQDGLGPDDALVTATELTERLKMEVFRQLGVTFEFVDGVVVPVIPVNDIPVVRETTQRRSRRTNTEQGTDHFANLPRIEFQGETYLDTRSLQGTVFGENYPDFRTESGTAVWINARDGQPTELGTALVEAFAGSS